jgi:hypothetical protein
VSFAPFRWGTRLRIKRLYQSSDVTILENRAWSDFHPANHDIHHGSGQVIGPDYLIGELRPKRRVDPSQEAVVEFGSFRGSTG